MARTEPEELYGRYLEVLRHDPSIRLAHVCALHPELKDDLLRLDGDYRRAHELLEELGLVNDDDADRVDP